MKTIQLIIMLATCAAVCGCAGTRSASTTDESMAESPTTAVSRNTGRRLSYFFLEAVRQQQNGDYAAAFDLLLHCRDISPSAAEVYFALAPYFSSLDNDSAALQCMRKAAALRPGNSTYTERLAETSINMRQYDEAIECYEKLYSDNRERTDVLNMLIQLYGSKHDYDAMIDAINRVEAVEGSSERIALARMRVYSLQGRKDKELEELSTLAEKHPDDMNYRVMKGNWLLQNARPEEAYNEYDYVLQQEPDNQAALMSLLDYYKAQGEDSLLNALQERLLISTDTPVKTKLTMMVKYVGQHKTDTATVTDLFNRILAEPQSTSAMHELYASYMSLIKMPQDSVENMLAKALDIEPDNASVRFQMIQMRWAAQDYDGVIALSAPALEFNPDEMAFYYFYGMGHFMKGDKDEALNAFKRGVSQIDEESDKDIVSDFYAIMGDILYEKQMPDEAFAAYDSSLQWKEDNIGCLNNYAYYLSVLGKELKKAEKMSSRAVRAEPSNSTYLDTYAWVLFKEGRYEEAKIYIDMAVQCDTTSSAVIIEHAGDIYAVNGDIDKAVEYWQKAVDAGSDSKAIIRKIRQRKYIKDE